MGQILCPVPKPFKSAANRSKYVQHISHITYTFCGLTSYITLIMSSTPTEYSIPANPRQAVADAYNVLAEPYLKWKQTNDSKDGERGLQHQFDHFLQLMRQFAENSSNVQVLEIGCGAGVPWTDMAAHCLQDTGHITAIDISQAQIDLASKYLLQSDKPHSNITLLCQDTMSLDYEPNQFDAIYAIFSLIHLPQQDQKTVLANIHKWLKPDGVVFMNFSGHPEADESVHQWIDDKTEMYWSSLGLDGYDKQLKYLGFDMVVREIAINVEDGNDIPFVYYIAKKV
jgi:ubiquinone/menaquinone biosynthesis C-methylase UbiE